MLLYIKNKYETCLAMLERLRLEQPALREEVLSYAGILDPMAEGVVPILVGKEENVRRSEVHGTQKIYRVKVLVGVTTDSGDLLGIVTSRAWERATLERLEQLRDAFVSHKRDFLQTVPMHSNRKVDGKPLWWWILNGKLIPRERRPQNNLQLFRINYLGREELLHEDLCVAVHEMQRKIPGRFRMDLVAPAWEAFLTQHYSEAYTLLSFELHVSSGFYVRTFVEDISERLEFPLCVYSLERTEIIF